MPSAVILWSFDIKTKSCSHLIFQILSFFQAINPELERAIYKRANAVVTELKGSHTIVMSQPEAVAKVIETAAKVVTANR